MTIQTSSRKVQLSVTVSPELKALAEEIAKENNTTKSGLISRCLEELARKRLAKLMEDGYREMAKENESIAEQSLSIVSETWPK